MRKRFGQHFLIDQHVIDRIVHYTDHKAHQSLVEIGPGPGTLTKPLLAKYSALTAIEIDRDLVAQLSPLSDQYSEFTLINQDVLEWLQAHTFTKNSVIVGNLPYNITTPIFFGLIKQAQNIDFGIFMIQKEVALRLAAKPGTKQYGRLTVMMQYFFDIDILFHVGPECFKPPPKVVSSVIRMAPKQTQRLKARDAEVFSTVVKLAFGQRRKQLRNALSSLLEGQSLEDDSLLKKRAEQLTIDDYIHLSNQLGSNQSTDI